MDHHVSHLRSNWLPLRVGFWLNAVAFGLQTIPFLWGKHSSKPLMPFSLWVRFLYIISLLGSDVWQHDHAESVSLAMILRRAIACQLPDLQRFPVSDCTTGQIFVQVGFCDSEDSSATVGGCSIATGQDLLNAEAKLQNVDPLSCSLIDVEGDSIDPREPLLNNGGYLVLSQNCIPVHLSQLDSMVHYVVPCPYLMLCDGPATSHDAEDLHETPLQVPRTTAALPLEDNQCVDAEATPCDPLFHCDRAALHDSVESTFHMDHELTHHVDDLSGECGLLPRMPDEHLQRNTDAPEQVDVHDTGVVVDAPEPCAFGFDSMLGPAGVSQDGGVTLLGQPVDCNTVSSAFAGECGLLPRMPGTMTYSDDFAARAVVGGSHGLSDVAEPVDASLQDGLGPSGVAECDRGDGGLSSTGESGLLPRMPSLCLPNGTDQVPATAIDDSDHDEQMPYDFGVPPGTKTNKRGHPDQDLFLPLLKSPLVHLSGQSLLRLKCPMPNDDHSLQSIRAQRIHVTDRLQILANQQYVWADDEVVWHLDQVLILCEQRRKNNLGHFPFKKVIYADPLLVQGWIANKFDSFGAWMNEHADASTCILFPMHSHGHWTPVVVWFTGAYIQIRTWDDPNAMHDHVELLVEALSAFVQLPHVHNRLHRMFCEVTCGAFTIAFFRSFLLEFPLPEVAEQAIHMHSLLRHDFEASLRAHSTCLKPWVWGTGTVEQAVQGLSKVLAHQGVPDDQVESRCRAAVRAIGSGPVLTALDSKTPWRQLKSLGNNVKFQFLLPSELDAKIAKQAGKGPVGRAKGVKSTRKPIADISPVEIDPTKLVIEPGTFHCQGQPLNQVSLPNLGPLTEGVVICRAVDVEPYLRSGKALSKGPIGLLLLDTWTTALPQGEVTVPCRCIANKEPMLIEATLIQLGTGSVERAMEQKPVCIDTLDICTVKFLVYRDEIQGTWSDFCSAPVKYIVQQFPVLKLCKENPCDCPHWHNEEKVSTSTAMLDVWRRQFLRSGFKPDQAANACMYTVCFRTPKCLLDRLLHASGTGGVYTEPRTPDAKEIDSSYVVIWVPKVSKAELWHLKQTNPTVVGVARAADRVGLRTLAKHAPALNELVRPGSSFLPLGPRQTWQVGPMPFGADRNSITRALTSLPWEVKVLQWVRTLPGRGSIWLVQSVTAPPQTMMQMKHGEVVFTCVKSGEQDVKAPTMPIATPETLALCGSNKPVQKPSGSSDPWAQNDPWGQWKGPTAAGHDVTATIRQIETKVHDAVLAKLPNATPMDEDVPGRLTTLESQMQTLMTKHNSLEGQVQDHAARHSAQLTTIQTQLQGHVASQEQSIAAMFEQQMMQIRGLLSKRSRDDAELWQHGVRMILVVFLCMLLPGLVYCPWIATHASLNPMLVSVIVAVCLFLWVCSCRFLRTIRSGSCTLHCRTHSLVSVLLILTSCCRIGEAANPGPTGDRAEHEFCIGAFNPSGLAHKATYIAEFLSHGDIWLTSETHLTEKSMRSFREELKFASSPHRFCVGGHPVPPRHDSQIAGQWRGVATLSKHPTKAIPHEWSSVLHQSSRLQVTITLLHDMWVTCGTMYGETCGPDHPRYLENNERLLQALTQQICFHSTGPRVLAGDWNVHAGDLPSFEVLRQQGFKDLQDVAYERWGLLPRPTCKNVSRKDYCYISPELQGVLQKVTLDDTVWSDHAVLCGHFKGHFTDLGRLEWKLPQPLPWPESLDVSHCQWPGTDVDPSDRYHQIWTQLEAAAQRQQPQATNRGMLGRGRPIKLRRKFDTHKQKPNAGRHGDIEPTFHGPSVMHARWFRQLRRLQSYLRFARGAKWSPDNDHAVHSWGAIRRATGFQGSFAEWWTSSSHKVANAPTAIPEWPPDANVCLGIYESFTLAVRAFENQLKQHCQTYASRRRAENPNLIFQDIKAPGKEGVTLLTQARDSAITVIDPDWCHVVTEHAVDWNVQCMIWCKGTPFSIVHVEDENVWLHSVDGLQVGDCLTQKTFTGQVDELAAEFTATWRKRWMRHLDVLPSQWDTTVRFAQTHLPKVPCTYSPFDAPTLQHAIHRKRKRSARGLDGVSLDDLRAVPDAGLCQLASVCTVAETIGRWPRQALAGKVSSIAKVPHPTSPSDFRPITILSHLYRLWGSHHCRRLLGELEHALPPQLYGNRKGCCATMVWSALAWQIETAQLDDRSLCGVQADVQKAFNHIPRLVCFEAAAAVGFPIQVLMGWAGALHDLLRHFELRNHLTPGLPSCTGMPEGDSLSCLGMLLIDWIFDCWFAVSFPLARPVSFVDDWHLLVQDPTHVAGAVSQLERFCQAVDLLLDTRKTFVWATQSPSRALLRQEGRNVEHCARTLGAHLQFTLQTTNSTLTKKFAAMPEMWERLRMTRSPHFVKSRAIRTAAWPNCLHGCFAVHLGQHNFTSLRSGAVKGLGADGSGVNPWLVLGAIEPTCTDPEFWSICATLRQVRLCGDPSYVTPLLISLASGFEGPPNGITTTLLHRLHRLGWSVTLAGRCQDMWGDFDLFSSPLEEILARAEWAWNHVIAQQVSHRYDFQRFHLVDIQATRAWMHLLPLQDQAAFRKILNGAIFTEDGKSKWDADVTGQCPFCLCQDGRFHRWWICEAFAEERAKVRPDVLDLVPHLPPCLTHCGWSILPHTTNTWRKCLLNIADAPIPAPAPLQCKKKFVDVFTDGSCWYPAQPALRFASFAILGVASGQTDSWIIQSGPLPGLIQNAFRAELYACRQALRWAIHWKQSLRLWIDCQSVLQKLCALQASSVEPSRNSKHADLWRDIYACLHNEVGVEFSFTKDAAHQSFDACETALEDWVATHNGLVDRQANLANQQRPPAFWELFHEHSTQVDAVAVICRDIQRHQMNVSRAVLHKQKLREAGAVTQAQLDSNPAPAPLPAQAWTPLPDRGPFTASLLQKYGKRQCETLCDWYWGVLAHAESRVEWISMYQLYIDYMGSQQCGGPVVANHKWYDPVFEPDFDLTPFLFKRRCSWWGKMFREILACFGASPQFTFGRPKSHMLSLHTNCCYIPWPAERCEIIECWIGRYLSHPSTRNGETVNKLPGDRGPRELSFLSAEQTPA